MNSSTKEVKTDVTIEDEDFDGYESLVPRRYQCLDDQKFEKFSKRNDWN